MKNKNTNRNSLYLINEIAAMTRKTKRSKYGAEKKGGYDSKKEYRRAMELKLLEKEGIISELREQVRFELLPKQEVIGFNGKAICGRRKMEYVADFVYMRDDKEIVEDSKGFRTDVYKRKKRLMKRILGIDILET